MGKAALSKVKLYGRIFVPVKNRNQICSCKLRIRGRKIFLRYNWEKWCFKRRICICVSANTAPRWKVRARSKLSNSICRRAGARVGMVVRLGRWVRVAVGEGEAPVQAPSTLGRSLHLHSGPGGLVFWWCKCMHQWSYQTGLIRPTNHCLRAFCWNLSVKLRPKSETVTKTLRTKWGQRVCLIWPTWPSVVTNNNQTTSGKKHDGRLQPASGCSEFMTAIQLQRVETLL